MKIQRSDPEEIVRKYIDAYNKFDIDSMLLLMSEDISFTNLSDGENNTQTIGKHELAMLARQSADFFLTRTQSIKSMNVTDETVTVEIDFAAVLAKDMPNGLKTGDTLSFRGKTEFVLKDGLIKSIVDES